MTFMLWFTILFLLAGIVSFGFIVAVTLILSYWMYKNDIYPFGPELPVRKKEDTKW